MKKRKLKLVWSCSNFVNHEHKTRIGAWLCGKAQRVRRLICSISDRKGHVEPVKLSATVKQIDKFYCIVCQAYRRGPFIVNMGYGSWFCESHTLGQVRSAFRQHDPISLSILNNQYPKGDA